MTWTVTISISGGGGKLGQEVGEEDEENKLQFIGKHKRWWDRVSLLTISQNCIKRKCYYLDINIYIYARKWRGVNSKSFTSLQPETSINVNRWLN